MSYPRLKTQPPGPVILLAHSMGGLLAADAAVMEKSSEANRIIGLVAFDVPYLGMHPHVVISGIASLFAKEEDDAKARKDEGKDEGDCTNMPEMGSNVKTEHELNDERIVRFVDQRVVDDWGSVYGQNLEGECSEIFHICYRS
jgi:alpha-beta hydrolase superfamily lysophospholipase